MSLLREGANGPSNNARFDPYFYLFVFALFCLSAFRFGVGWDYYQYYWTIVSNLQTNIVGRGEIATVALVHLSSKLGITNLYFAINAFITIFLISKTINQYSVNKWVSIFVFLCFPLFFLSSLSVIRFYTALSIVFFAFRYIKSREIFKYLILVYIASMFHSSAAIAVALYFFAKVNLTAVRIIVLCILAVLLSGVANTFASTYLPEYAVYTEDTTVQEGTVAIYFFAAILVVCLPLVRRINLDENAKLYLSGFVFGFLIYIAFYGQGTMSHRLSLFGTTFSLLLIPKVISLIFRGKTAYINIYVYLMLTLVFFYSLQVGAQTYLPYRTIFATGY